MDKSLVVVKVKRISPDVIMPSYANPGDAGLDIFAFEDCVLKPGERRLFKTGLCLEIPDGYEVQIRPRSGNAVKFGIGIVNSPATIDSGYRGELGVVLINHGDRDFVVNKGVTKIAQMVVAPVIHATLEEVDELSATVRGGGGFGSSDQKK